MSSCLLSRLLPTPHPSHICIVRTYVLFKDWARCRWHPRKMMLLMMMDVSLVLFWLVDWSITNLGAFHGSPSPPSWICAMTLVYPSLLLLGNIFGIIVNFEVFHLQTVNAFPPLGAAQPACPRLVCSWGVIHFVWFGCLRTNTACCCKCSVMLVGFFLALWMLRLLSFCSWSVLTSQLAVVAIIPLLAHWCCWMFAWRFHVIPTPSNGKGPDCLWLRFAFAFSSLGTHHFWMSHPNQSLLFVVIWFPSFQRPGWISSWPFV